MNKKLYFLIMMSLLMFLPKGTVAQLKAVKESKPIVDTSMFIDITEPVIISDANNGDPGNWFIYDADPGLTDYGEKWSIDNEYYDSDADVYATQLIGKRKSLDPSNTADYYNYNSFFLWSRTDSGVPWNIRQSVVHFKIKVLDGQPEWAYQPSGGDANQFAVTFFVALDYGENVDFGPFKVLFVAEDYMKPIHVDGEAYFRWWEYFPTGLGTDLNDGNWHTFEFDLVDVITRFKQYAIDELPEPRDPKLGDDATEGVNWNFYGVLGMQVTCLNALVDDVRIQPSLSTGIQGEIFGNEIKLSPNPSSGLVTVNGIENNVTVNVYNLTGSLVYSRNDVAPGTRLDLSGLSNGSYLVNIKDGAKSSTQKLIILKR